MIHVANEDLLKYIDNQIKYLDDKILHPNNIKIEVMHRYQIYWVCQIKKYMITETERFLRVKFINELIHRVMEINNSYIPKGEPIIYDQYFKLN
tara:strand:- start:576 stop:857 length:282 start_codon:yes stop_codon:yes gene_type:complete